MKLLKSYTKMQESAKISTTMAGKKQATRLRKLKIVYLVFWALASNF